MMTATTRTRTRNHNKHTPKRKGKARPNRVGIPMDPQEYEGRRLCAQRAVDRVHGPGKYRVVGQPGEMLNLVKWVDYKMLPMPEAAPAMPAVQGRIHRASMRSSHAA
ncbi:MAG: hypothetical protein WD768_14595 [Phycisphaeraceae bacterium]